MSEPDLASELRLVLGKLVRRLRAERGSGFPLQHAAVLARLEREGPQTTSALAAAEHVRQQSMAQTVAELHAAGLVERRQDPDDRRQVLIEASGRGRETLAADRRRRDTWLARAIENELTPDEQRLLRRVLPLLRRLTES